MENDSTAQSMAHKLHALAKKKGVSPDLLRRDLMLERAVARLVDEPGPKIILKGGFVSQRVYLTERTTKDVDIAATDGKEKTIQRLNEVPNKQLDDNCKYQLISIVENDHQLGGPGLRAEYFGWIGSRLEPQKRDMRVSVDVTFSEPANSRYIDIPPVMGDQAIRAHVVTRETTVAEKLHTLAFRGDANSRARDVYDVFKMLPQCGAKQLRNALTHTYNLREGRNFSDLPKVLAEIDPKVIKGAWKSTMPDIAQRVSFDSAWSYLQSTLSSKLREPDKEKKLDLGKSR